MNDYYESRIPSGKKPTPTTDIESVKRFIKDKYVKKLWIDEDEEDPVMLYQTGQTDKAKKKKEKKDKKEKKEKKEKKDKKEKKEKKEKKTKGLQDQTKADEDDLIDFKEEGNDDFGDFQEARETNAKTQSDDI